MSWQNARGVPHLCLRLSDIKRDSCFLLVTMSFPGSSEIEKFCHLDSSLYNVVTFDAETF